MKTNISGLNKDYKKMLEAVKSLDSQLFITGYAISDLPYHCCVGEEFKQESEIYHTIEQKVKELKLYLESVIR